MIVFRKDWDGIFTPNLLDLVKIIDKKVIDIPSDCCGDGEKLMHYFCMTLAEFVNSKAGEMGVRVDLNRGYS